MASELGPCRRAGGPALTGFLPSESPHYTQTNGEEVLTAGQPALYPVGGDFLSPDVTSKLRAGGKPAMFF